MAVHIAMNRELHQALAAASAQEAQSLLAFEAEAMPHWADLFRSAVRMTGDRSRAQDVVQEVYLQAWRSFARFERGTNCRAWLFKILFHCVSHERRRWLRFPLLKETEEFLETNLAAPAPISQHLTDGEIIGALDAIPASFRAAVLLVDVEEMSYKEAAEILGVPIGTVMSRLSRARKLLRERLGEAAAAHGIGIDGSGTGGEEHHG
jgi:RNA polymerase sigma-70 factor (ECF subfamily)